MIDLADIERAQAELNAEIERRMAATTSWLTDTEREPLTYEEAIEAQKAYILAKMGLTTPIEPSPPVLTVIEGGKK